MAKRRSKPAEEPAKVNVTEAIHRAAEFLDRVFADEEIKDIRLEEVEFVDDEDVWSVTLSFLRRIPEEQLSGFARNMKQLGGQDYERVYKSVEVDGRSGEAHSIKMRSPV